MIKRSVLFVWISALCLLSVPHSAWSQQAQIWKFCAVLVPEKLKGCPNEGYTSYEYKWISNDKTQFEALRSQWKEKYGKKSISIYSMPVKGHTLVIGLVKKYWKCGGYNLSFYCGKNEAAIISQAESDKKLHSDIADYELLKLFYHDREIDK